MTDTLRSRAVKLLQENKTPLEYGLSPEEIRRTLHELHVHQIELEMQNEELRRVQVELEVMRDRYFGLYDLAPVGYVTLSEKGVILEANFTVTALLGMARGELVSKPITQFILKEDQDIYYQHCKRLDATREPQTCELRMVKGDEAPLWVRLDATSRQDASGAYVSSVVVSDVSERVRTQELQKQIELVIAHDLRSPAGNAVNVAALLLQDENLTAAQRELLSLLKDSGKKMLHTLDRAREIYLIETGQYHGIPEMLDCLSMVREIVQNLRNVSRFKKTPVTILANGVSPAPHASVPCLGQFDLLSSALDNLIKNALEAAPQGEAVLVNLVPDAGLRIEIRNRGVVPLDIRERFFEKHVTSGKSFGTGLGTYSAKKLIEAQGGTLEMQTFDERDETVLTIRLPEKM